MPDLTGGGLGTREGKYALPRFPSTLCVYTLFDTFSKDFQFLVINVYCITQGLSIDKHGPKICTTSNGLDGNGLKDHVYYNYTHTVHLPHVSMMRL